MTSYSVCMGGHLENAILRPRVSAESGSYQKLKANTMDNM